MQVDKRLFEILACPKCKSDVRFSEKDTGVICYSCKLIYPVKEDIPIMLIDEAKRLTHED